MAHVHVSVFPLGMMRFSAGNLYSKEYSLTGCPFSPFIPTSPASAGKSGPGGPAGPGD